MIDTGPENFPTRTADDKPVAFHDVPQSSFPFRMRFIDVETNKVMHEVVVRGIGSVQIPGFAHLGIQVKVEMTFANGMQHTEWPDGKHEAKQLSPPPRF